MRLDGNQRSGQSRRRQGFAGLLALVALAVLAVWLPHRTAHPAVAAANDARIPVEATIVSLRNVEVTATGLGAVTAFNSVTITPQVGGQIISEPYKEGQEVRKGQLLVQINPAPYQAALDQVLAKQAQDQATLEGAETDLKRYAVLIKQNYTSRQKYDDQVALADAAKAQVTADRAAVEAAKVNLAFTRITAPVAGRLGLKLIDTGNVVAPGAGSPIVTVMQIHPITIVSTLPQQDLSRVIDALNQRGKQQRSPGGNQNRLSVLAYDGSSQHLLSHGTLLTINNQVDAATGTFQLKSVFPNRRDRLWPGRFVVVRLVLKTLAKVPTVPSDAVQRGPDGYYLYAIHPNNTVHRLPVTLRQDADGVAVIATGAAPGARVVLSGAGRLDEGTPVEIVTRTAPAG
jgi:multidrug efflux system membrane fusion protein